MDVILVYNGLGNQMSQYALYLKKKTMGQKVSCVFKNTAHNGIELNRLFGINIENSILSPFYSFLVLVFSYTKFGPFLDFVKRILDLFCIKGIMESGDYTYHPEVLERKSGLIIVAGGWHHYRYLDNIEEKIRDIYKFPDFTDDRNNKVKKEASTGNAIAIHIRRGDYLNGKFGNVCTESYYRNCIQYFEKIIENPVFYIFSNDMEWSKNFFEGHNAVYIDWNTGDKSWEDMALMSCFNNLIIANSTFSWWAGWLGNNNCVLCPPYFVGDDEKSDIYPPHWVRIPNS